MEQSTKDKIQKIIDENDVLLFMKGTPVMPQCGFSAAVGLAQLSLSKARSADTAVFV